MSFFYQFQPLVTDLLLAEITCLTFASLILGFPEIYHQKKKPTFVSVFLGNAHYLMKQTNCTTLWQRKQLSISRSCPCAQADEEVGG